MTRRHWFAAIVFALFALPSAAVAQGAYGAMTPTGPPLAPLSGDVHRASWIEEVGGVTPAGAGSGTATLEGPKAASPGGQASFLGNNDQPSLSSIWDLLKTSDSLQVLMGGYVYVRLGPDIRAFNYLPVSIRQQWGMGNPFGPDAPLPGYWEFVTDLTGAAIISSYGTWFAGGSLMWRYNWADPGSAVTPYSQAGAGTILNNAYHDRHQGTIGEMLEFYLHVEAGLKFRIADNLTLDVEGGLQHISNGGLAKRNLGANMLGVAIGFTYYCGGATH